MHPLISCVYCSLFTQLNLSFFPRSSPDFFCIICLHYQCYLVFFQSDKNQINALRKLGNAIELRVCAI